MVNALFSVADGKLGIGREEESRFFEMIEIICDVLLVGFLIGTEDHAKRIGKFASAPMPIPHRVSPDHKGTLIIERAATDQIAVVTRHIMWILRPAGSTGNRVEMGDQADLFAWIRAFIVCSADISLMAGSLHAQAGAEIKSGVKSLAGPRSKRFALPCLAPILLAWDVDERFDFRDDRFPIFLDPGIDIFNLLISVHGLSFPSHFGSSSLYSMSVI